MTMDNNKILEDKVDELKKEIAELKEMLRHRKDKTTV